MNWSGWHDHIIEGKNLYADWFETLRGDQASNLQPLPFGPDKRLSEITIDRNSSFRFDFLGDSQSSPSFDRILNEFGVAVAGPSFATDKNFDRRKPPFSEANPWRPPEDAPCLPPETVIVGIIDTGIALGHRRTRLPDGKTRFLTAWQQSAVPPLIKHPQSGNLPFGRELFADEINSLLDKHSVGGIENGWLDEEAFNRAAGLVDFRNVFGQRILARRAAHGTHVLDLAAGYDPKREPELANKVRLVAINLPSREVVGLSGSFLELYVAMGIARIIEVADGYAQRAKETPGFEPAHGDYYPIAINISFGKQAGPRDGISGLIERLIRAKNEKRKDPATDQNYIDKGTVFLSMPAGNDNLLRSNATFDLTNESEQCLTWRILPQDQSSNYVEIWSDDLDDNPPDSVAAALDDLRVSLYLPDGTEWNGSFDEGSSQQSSGLIINEIDKKVRIYCTLVSRTEWKGTTAIEKTRIHYLICVSPTLVQIDPSLAAPAGLWRIGLGTKRAKMTVFTNVQTDQSALPDGITGLRSHFEDSEYVLFDETTGRLSDTYPYPVTEESIRQRQRSGVAYPGNDKEASAVKRHGTLNALAINRDYSIVAGGYRATDGAPADYSASGGTGVIQRIGHFMGAPTLALVTDDGAAHPGILSAGARDGSTVSLRGTSFAAPQIVRKISECLIVDRKMNFNPKAWIKEQAQEGGMISINHRRFSSGTDIEKTGRGRYPQLHYRGLNRLSGERE